ncbi:MAG: hypothetical protein IKA76_02340 [Clostridia bacterium]|nr:hypothetical protein [Clostridia bacterium]
MKIFWGSLVAFALVLTGIIYNGVSLHKTTNRMQDLLNTPTTDAMEELDNLWQEHRGRIGWTVGRRRIAVIDERLSELKWAYEEGKTSEFQKYRALLSDAIKELIRGDTLTLDSIF